MSDAPAQRPVALIVEDQYMLGLQARRMLASIGFRCEGPVASREDALALLDRQSTAGPDGAGVSVALLDVNLSEGDSLSVARELHERRIPFIFVTGYAKSGLPREAGEMAAVLQKPVSLATLRSALAEALGELPGDLASTA